MADILTTNDDLMDAAELAAVTMPAMYMVKEEQSLARRFANRLLAKPGPKPRMKTISYRGTHPPQLMQTLGKIGEYREDPVDLGTYDTMRQYAVVKLGLIVRAAPIFTALREAKVSGPDKAVNAFVKELLVDEWLVKLTSTAVVPSYVFGCAPHEIVWGKRDTKIEYIADDGEMAVAWEGDTLIYDDFRFVHPLSLQDIMIKKKTKNYDGIVQIPPPGETPTQIPPEKTFHYVNRFIWSGLWGESELRAVYPFWYYAEFFRALQADYLRFKAIPPIIGHAPPGTRLDDDGEEKDNLEVAGEVLMEAYSNLVVVLPDERDERGNQQWGYKELAVGQYSDTYTKAIEELEVGILRALLVPERTITQNMAAVGSYNQASQHAERMIEMSKLEVDHILEMFNKLLVPRLVWAHFGLGVQLPKIYAPTTSEAFKEKLQNIILTILQNDKFGVYAQQIAFKELLDFASIPFRVGDADDLPEPIVPGVDKEEDVNPDDDEE